MTLRGSFEPDFCEKCESIYCKCKKDEPLDMERLKEATEEIDNRPELDNITQINLQCGGW